MRSNNSIRVVLNGYTDNIGDSAYNQRLSEQRAEAARNFMIARGSNPQQRRLNRRLEIVGQH